MSFVTTVALALLLAVDPPAAPAPAAPPEASAKPAAAPAPPAAEPPAALDAPVPAAAVAPAALGVTATVVAPSSPAAVSTTTRRVRGGIGVSVTNATSGFASSLQAGVQVDPWDLFGFRAGLGMTTSVAGAGGWEAAELSGSAVFRPIGAEHRVAPYLGVGVQLAILAVIPEPPTPPPPGSARVAPGHLSPTFAAAAGGGGESEAVSGGVGQPKVMPEVTAGALIRLTPKLDLDLSARYLPLNWDGTTYNGLTFSVAICTPF